MLLDDIADTSPLAKGHQPSFSRAANVLDLGLAIGECAAALKRDFRGETDTIREAERFVAEVKHAPGRWHDTSFEIGYRTSSRSVDQWHAAHARFLARAKEIRDLISSEAAMAVGRGFVEPLERLSTKILEGEALASQKP